MGAAVARRLMALAAGASMLGACAAMRPADTVEAAPVVTPGFAAALRGGTPSPSQAPALRQAPLMNGDVLLAGPDGYCIDGATLRDKGRDGFAMLASCRILSGNPQLDRVHPALMTVSVARNARPDDLPGPQGLADLTGARLLSGETEGGTVIAHLSGGGDALLDSGDPSHWRAAFLLDGRLVSTALYAPEGSPLAGPDGRELLVALRDRMTDLNVRRDSRATPGGGGAGILQRVLGR